MRNSLRLIGWSGALVALVALGQMVACTTADADKDDSAAGGANGGAAAEVGGSGGADSTAAGGKTTGGSTGTSTNPASGKTICSDAVTLASSTTIIANFDNYDGTDITTVDWAYTIGTTGVYSGPFAYGDDHVIDAAKGKTSPETYKMVDGSESTAFALSISDTEADEYGGGMGVWLAQCVNAGVFQGISLWIRGVAPTGSAKLSLPMEATTSMTPKLAGDKLGTCASTANVEGDCVAPSYSVPVTATWTQHKIPWAAFTAGSAMGTPVKPDGNNIAQIQFDIGVTWEPDPSDPTGVKYMPVPAAYELAVDTIAFY